MGSRLSSNSENLYHPTGVFTINLQEQSPMSSKHLGQRISASAGKPLIGMQSTSSGYKKRYRSITAEKPTANKHSKKFILHHEIAQLEPFLIAEDFLEECRPDDDEQQQQKSPNEIFEINDQSSIGIGDETAPFTYGLLQNEGIVVDEMKNI